MPSVILSVYLGRTLRIEYIEIVVSTRSKIHVKTPVLQRIGLYFGW